MTWRKPIPETTKLPLSANNSHRSSVILLAFTRVALSSDIGQWHIGINFKKVKTAAHLNLRLPCQILKEHQMNLFIREKSSVTIENVPVPCISDHVRQLEKGCGDIPFSRNPKEMADVMHLTKT